MAAKPISIGPFPTGMDNRLPDYKLDTAESGAVLRDAFNVDITDAGSIKTRPGYALALAGVDCHSLWAPAHGGFALFCDDGALYRFDPPTGKTLVAAGFGASAPVRYAEVNEAIYFTDGLRVGSYGNTTTPTWTPTATLAVGDQQLLAMPAGQQIAYHGARLLVAVGSVLVYSEPFTPHLRDPAKGFEMFQAPITLLAAVEGGVFVVADKTYWIAGGFPAQSVQAVSPDTAPQQQAGYDQDGGAHWLSSSGIVTASPAGELRNLQAQRIAMRVGGAAATLYREADGMQTIVAAMGGENTIAAGVGSYAQARIVRKDV